MAKALTSTAVLPGGAPRLGRNGLPPAVIELCQGLSAAGHRSWIVGGSVRDSLMSQLRGDAMPLVWRAKDWDLATDATPDQVTRLFRRVIPTGIEHGTVTVLLGDAQIEVTTLRADREYRDGRHPEQIDFVTSIEEDLARRDFTVNAIAFELASQQLIDPFGGIADLRAEKLRAVGEASRRFAEDGLRVLRAARFVATLGFELEAETARAITPSLESYRRVSAERIRDEWNKTLLARAPSRGFRIMHEHGLLAITAPEVDALASTPALPDPAPSAEVGGDIAEAALAERARGDALSLACSRVDDCPARLELRLAALLAGIHPDAERAAELAELRLAALRYPNAERKCVTRLIRQRVPRLAVPPTAPELRRWLRRVGPDLYLDVCLLERANLRARAALDVAAPPATLEAELRALDTFRERVAEELAKEPPLTLSALAIDGKQLMAGAGYRPGRQLGNALEALLEQVLDDPTLNTTEQLLERARALAH